MFMHIKNQNYPTKKSVRYRLGLYYCLCLETILLKWLHVGPNEAEKTFVSFENYYSNVFPDFACQNQKKLLAGI